MGGASDTYRGQDRTGAYIFWWGNVKERELLEDLGIDGRIILKRIFKWDGGAWSGLMWLRIGTGDRSASVNHFPSWCR